MSIYTDLQAAIMFCFEHNQMIDALAKSDNNPNGVEFGDSRPYVTANLNIDVKNPYDSGGITIVNREIARIYTSNDNLSDYGLYHVMSAISHCGCSTEAQGRIFTEYILPELSNGKISYTRTSGICHSSCCNIANEASRAQINDFVKNANVALKDMLSYVNVKINNSEHNDDRLRYPAHIKADGAGDLGITLIVDSLDKNGEVIEEDGLIRSIKLYDYYTPSEAMQEILTTYYNYLCNACAKNGIDRRYNLEHNTLEVRKLLYNTAKSSCNNKFMKNINAWLFSLLAAPDYFMTRERKATQYVTTLKQMLKDGNELDGRSFGDSIKKYFRTHSDEDYAKFLSLAAFDVCGTLWCEKYATDEEKKALTDHGGAYSAYADALKFMHGVDVCENCGEIFSISDLQEVVDGTIYNNTYGNTNTTYHWCEECAEHNAFKSPHSERYFTDDVNTVPVRFGLRDDDIELWTEVEAQEDATCCCDCGDFFTREYAISRGMLYEDVHRDDICICNACWNDNNWTTCGCCGCAIHNEEAYYNEDRDEWYCESCWEDNQPRELDDYGHTYGMYFRNSSEVDEPEPELYLGVELETECGSDGSANCMARDIKQALDKRFVACKYDGSLNDGCEIVSQPFTPWYHLNEGREEYWSKIFEQCDNWNATSYHSGRCGLHIHISRSYLDNDDAVFRLDRMVQNHRDEFLRFSMRGSNTSYCEIDTDYRFGIKDSDSADEKAYKYKKEAFRKGKYCAVNIEHSQTVEIRLWRGTLNEHRFYATLEMTTGMAFVAHDYTNEFIENCTWDELKEAILKCLNDYNIEHEELNEYLEERNL